MDSESNEELMDFNVGVLFGLAEANNIIALYVDELSELLSPETREVLLSISETILDAIKDGGGDVSLQ